MPRDDWAKYRRRDKGRTALRDGLAFKVGRSGKASKRRRKRGYSTARPESFITVAEWLSKIRQATRNGQLDCIGRDLMAVRQFIKRHDFRRIVQAGIERRQVIADNDAAYAGATHGH